ncbi:TonB-dependent receptor family protein [Marinobacterium arenosum]|uniref:TonB-dependent receptor family protein n=1 Tax=Marinobacterium arenosum TaxID=2862496 RepID=UPI001C96BE4E|nr:TonB-dependent siderophore receptor [Marinobacterium arenosum]MBY4677357.1 TonB-dependent siderophore receptor [Marinobacterium arenosum]
MHWERPAPALISPLFLAISSILAATAQAEEVNLERLVISGDWLQNSAEADLPEYTGARSLIDRDSLQNKAVLNIEDALNRVPGVRVADETGTGVLPNISIRGLNPLRSVRVQALQDGIPVSLGPYSHLGLSLFPLTLNSIERIDIVRGGAAVHYGPNNVGGVINFISRPISREQETELQQRLTAWKGGNLLHNTYLRSGGYLTDDFGLQLQLDSQYGESFRDHSDTEVNNLSLDAIWHLSQQQTLKGHLQYYKADSELAGALLPEAYEQDRQQSQRPFDAFEADTWRGSLVYNQQFDNDSELNWSLFGHDSDRRFDFGFPFDPSEATTDVRSSPRNFKVFGTEPRYSFLLGDNQQITIGARLIDEEISYKVDRKMLSDGSSSTLRDWKFDTRGLALYASDTISLADGRLKLTPGLRLEDVETDYRDLNSGTTDRNSITEWLPGLTVGYQLTDDWFLFANTQQSLNPPQIAQVARDGLLTAEQAWNYELGARYFPNSSSMISATLFRIDFEDKIEFDRTALTFMNLGEARYQGLELEADWQPDSLPALSLNAAYTYLDTEQRSGANQGNELPFTSHHQLYLAADYAIADWQLNLNTQYLSKAFSDAANTEVETANGSAGRMPSHWVWNAQASTRLSADSRLSVALNNIFDEDYYFRGVDVSPIGRVPAPGRSLTLTYNIQF